MRGYRISGYANDNVQYQSQVFDTFKEAVEYASTLRSINGCWRYADMDKPQYRCNTTDIYLQVKRAVRNARPVKLAS